MEKIDKMISGQRLRRERLRLSLSQEDVADKIGTTATNVSRWELGYTSPGFYAQRALGELFGKSLQELFPRLDPESPPVGQDDGVSDALLKEDGSTGQARARDVDSRLDLVFCFNIPLPSPDEFYGRREVWMPLLTRLRQRGSTSIVGQRRIGKTWLLSYLKLIADEKLGPGYHIGYIDATLPSCHTMAGLTCSMLEALAISPVSNATADEYLVTLEKALKELRAKEEALVLCIDEFEGLCSTQAFDVTILESLRALASNCDLRLVVASRQPLIELVRQLMGKSYTSPFFNIFEQVTLAPFTGEGAEAFAHDKSKQAGFTQQEHDYLLNFGQVVEEGKQEWPPLRLQLVGKMIREDKVFFPHRLLAPDYWQRFKERLEEQYRGVVG